MAERSYPVYEVWGALGAAEWRYPVFEVRDGGWEELPHAPKPEARCSRREE